MQSDPDTTPASPALRPLGTIVEEVLRFLLGEPMAYHGTFEWMKEFHSLFIMELTRLKVFDFWTHDELSVKQGYLIREYHLVPQSVLIH
jgi:membrane protein YdbS with pleckstrin-like domain